MELFKSRTRVAYTNAVGDKVYPVVVDIKKGIKSTEDIQFVSSDVNTGILSVAFISGNENFNVSGADVICSVMRPDASTLELPCEVVRENIVEVPLGINGTSQDGIYSFDFKVLKGGNKVVGTPIMNYSVSLSIGNDMVVEEDDRLPVLTMLMTQLTELKGEARESINQANTATVASREATANAIEATNNANAVSERVSQETSEVISRVNNKVTEVENRFNALTSKQQQDAEVIDARDGEVSLKTRLDRDIEKAKQVYVNVEGSHISTDSNVGYLKDVKILGNTIQSASNLADIRSVGDTVEGQELYEISVVSCGKNLFDGEFKEGKYETSGGSFVSQSKISANVNTILINENTNYSINRPTLADGINTRVLFYDKNMKYLSGELVVGNASFMTPVNTKYINFHIATSVFDDKLPFQLEEGTVATPYEPYQEDKLTILSPVQLEKVGDVADRIVCKDGVWGVEKNIETVVLNGSEGWVLSSSYTSPNCKVFTSQVLVGKIIDTVTNNFELICDQFIIRTVYTTTEDTEGVIVSGTETLWIKILNSKLPTQDVQGFKQWLQANNVTVKYQLATPTFIPLPHDQQIKLRTFANKTNISFLTEIEGTIKAQVPKSLGATVNTHTTQISNLNKELNRVKKLEESTVSTVETESDFTTVEATSNGYFEDVKLEGKTLVNLWGNKSSDFTLGNHVSFSNNKITYSSTDTPTRWNNFFARNLNILKPNTEYTVITNVIKNELTAGTVLVYYPDSSIGGGFKETDFIKIQNGKTGIFINKISTRESFSALEDTLTGLRSYFDNTSLQSNISVELQIILLEGDHTQNPPSYFEGLKSVGQGVDEIVVSSVNENLFEYDSFEVYTGKLGLVNKNKNMFGTIRCINNTDKVVLFLIHDKKTDAWIREKSVVGNGGVFETTLDINEYVKYITVTTNSGWNIESMDTVETVLKNTLITNSKTLNTYTPHQSDKKRLLYYNNETQAWEKPILREWDSIEKHADGKYYYHQRSGEVVLNGSESSWGKSGVNHDSKDMLRFYVNANAISTPNNVIGQIVSDKFNTNSYDGMFNDNIEGISVTQDGKIGIGILKSKLSTQDVAGFKKWLQANNVTVVYQLAEEKVYECTNIDLITYANETNYIVESGAIAPKSILKVHNNISNVVKILQEKVSLLENKFIEGLKQVLAGDMYSLAELLYPEDFREVETENEVMLLPLE